MLKLPNVGIFVGAYDGSLVNNNGSKLVGVGWSVIREGVGCNVNSLGVGCNVNCEGVGTPVNTFLVGSCVGVGVGLCVADIDINVINIMVKISITFIFFNTILNQYKPDDNNIAKDMKKVALDENSQLNLNLRYINILFTNLMIII